MDHHENKTEYKQGGLHLQVTKLPLMDIVLTDKEGNLEGNLEIL